MYRKRLRRYLQLQPDTGPLFSSNINKIANPADDVLKKSKKQSLTTGSIKAHVRKMALPASIGMFFQTMYSVVDSFYAGQISTMDLAAMGLSFPVYLLLVASSNGTARGASALIANAIGRDDEEAENLYITQSISLGLLLSLLLTLAGLYLVTPLFQLMGAEGVYLSKSEDYIHTIFFGSVFLVMSSLCNGILLASGDSTTYSRMLMVGFFLNVLLDPWFVYGGFGLPPMGITGIALATVLILGVGCLFLIGTVIHRGLLDISDWRAFIPKPRVYGEIAQQAVPASFNLMSVALGFFVTTYFLHMFDPHVVAAYGVTTRIEQIALLPSFGLYAAIMSLVGQNNGAGKIDRVCETMSVCNYYGLLMTVTSSTLMFTFAEPLMRAFSDDPEVMHVGVTCLRIFAFVQWAYVMTSTHLAMLQAIKHPTYGYFESVTRKIILPVPLLFLFIGMWHKDVTWIWYTSASTTIFMTLITVVFARSVLKKTVAGMKVEAVVESA